MIVSTYRHFLLSNIKCTLVCFLGLIHNVFSLVSGGDFSQVSVVIALHFQVEDFGLARGRLNALHYTTAYYTIGVKDQSSNKEKKVDKKSMWIYLWDEMFIEQAQNDVADFLEFLFDLVSIFKSISLNIIIWKLDQSDHSSNRNWKRAPLSSRLYFWTWFWCFFSNWVTVWQKSRDDRALTWYWKNILP